MFSIRLTPFNVLMLLSSTFILFTVIIFFLIAYTPMRQLVPGYGKGSDPSSWMELNQKVEDLKRDLENRKLKENALNSILSEKESELDTVSAKSPRK
ncbi:MAG: hypothetical protein JNL57_08840 [Bacteroidetes bacterium]|nr:hypothetical protein [Bacteroidota bacterium]